MVKRGKEKDGVKGQHGASVVALVYVSIYFPFDLMVENAQDLLFEGVLRQFKTTSIHFLSLLFMKDSISNHWEQKEGSREENYDSRF